MTFLNYYLTVQLCRPSNTSLKGGHRQADTVEPRREFIQDNSLSANVDVRAMGSAFVHPLFECADIRHTV